jgi:hypothetical protein
VLNRSDLRAASLITCKMCVILGSPSKSAATDDPTLLDKSVILATLNVRAMHFSQEETSSARQNTSNGDPIWQDGSEVPIITDLCN